jgi:hypothetical protein
MGRRPSPSGVGGQPAVVDKSAFAAQDFESLANALAYYALLDGQPYPGYQDQMDFVARIDWR